MRLPRCCCALLPAGTALADDDKAKLFATTEQGFGRIIIDFPARLDLPHYKLTSDNGVLAVQFDAPVDFTLPDIASALPDYVTIARVDPDRRGVRFGMRTTFSVNHLEAGEQLFIDLMPTTWQGLPPGLPPTVVANLAARAKDAALRAEQAQKAAEAKISNPQAIVRVGRNPTFMRVEFQWNVDTDAKFAFDPKTLSGNLDFDWPVPVDLYLLKSNLPKELPSVDNQVTADGSRIVFHAAGKTVPRFYAVSARDYIIDIDTASTVPASPDPQANAMAKALADAATGEDSARASWLAAGVPHGAAAWAQRAMIAAALAPQPPITPQITTVGSTVRISFPFDRDTPAAVFRRGDTVWMLFDTITGINQPAFTQDLASLAQNFTVVPSGDLQVVRLDLSSDRLATLGSEGRSWVLSLGDALLTATEPMSLDRRSDSNGLYEMTADMERPGRIHQFTDPVVGDKLTVVTAFPPARGITHDLGYVDFNALRSIQGLVIAPQHDDVAVNIAGKLAVITAPGGLIVSPPDAVAEAVDTAAATASRAGFIDLGPLKLDDPVKFSAKADALTMAASQADGHGRDVARLQLARFYVANRYAMEAIGVLGVMQKELKTDDLRDDAQLTLAAADVLAHRPADALPILNSATFTDEIDARLWRALAEADASDYPAAKRDVLAAEPVVGTYPSWLRTRFLLAATRAAIETGDSVLAERFYKAIEFATLGPEQTTLYRLLAGRIAEAEGRTDEALDTYGQVIAADIRPTRAEAVYRTILILDQTGRIDLAKATATLAAEALLWRGNGLEADMDRLLTNLYFRHGDYRLAFETAKQTVEYFPDDPAMGALSDQARNEFEELYLNGKADQMQPVEALSLYYDFRALTPPGSRGDEMIRNLAERLVKVDLLGQAADLLKYQVDNRLKGAAQAQIATELAVIDIANRNPQAALEVLNGTQLADLPPNLARQRRVLEARALIDSSRDDLALDILTPITGRDADKLRVEADWNKKDYEDAGNQLELMYSPDVEGTSPPGLTQGGRMDVVRAGVAFALAGDKIGLSRLRSKFADALSRGPEWPMFDYVTSSIAPVTDPQFNDVAKAVSGIDTLDAFLKSYKQTYSAEGAITPDKGAPADGAATAAGATADGTPTADSSAPAPAAPTG